MNLHAAIYGHEYKGNFDITNSADKKTAVINITGPIYGWRAVSENFRQKVDLLLAEGVTDISGYIHSPGGDMKEADEIGNQILRFTGKRSLLYGAMVASAGTVIGSYFDPKLTFCHSNTSFMIHDPMWRPQILHLSDFDTAKKLYTDLRNNAIQRYHDITGQDKDKISADMQKTTWFNATELKKLGFVAGIKDEKAKLSNTDTQYIENMGISLPENFLTQFPKEPFTNPKNKNMSEINAFLKLDKDATEEQQLAAIKNLQTPKNETPSEAALKALCMVAESKGFNTDKIKALAAKDYEATLDMVESHEAPKNEGGEDGGEGKDPFKRLSDVLSGAIQNAGESQRKDKTLDDYSATELENMYEKDRPKYDQLFNAKFGNN